VSGETLAGTTSHPPMALLAALVSPVTYAFNIVLLRQQATTETPVQVVVVQATLVTLFVTPLAVLSTWTLDAASVWPMILAIGITSTAGYLILVKALAGLTAVRYSVIEYSGLIWAALIGWVWFSEQPTPALWFGSTLIVAGALITVIQRETAKP
jgi:drug/metabolite transporter (DMT)-like permease